MRTSNLSESVWRAAGMPALLILTAAGFSGYAALMPVAPLWAVSGGASEAGAGLVNGVLMLATILTQPTVPGLLRRFGAGRVLAAGLLLLNGPALLHLLSDNLTWILGLSTVRGLGFGIITVTGSAAVANLVPPARHGAAIGAYGAAIAVPQLLLLPAGPWLAEVFGFWLVFAIATVPVLAIGAAPRLGRALREREAEHASTTQRAKSSKQTQGTEPLGSLLRGLVPPMVILLGVTLAGGALITFTPQMSSSPMATTAGITALTATAALSRWRFGALADRYGAKRFLWPLILFTAVGLALAAASVAEPNATRVYLLLLGMTLVGIAYGGLQNLTLLLSLATVRRQSYNTASAVWNIGFDAGTGIGSVLVGSLAAGFSFPVALLAAAAASLATLPVAFLRHLGRGPSQEPAVV